MRIAGAVVVVLLVIWAATPTVNQTRPVPMMATSEGAGTAEEFSWETPLAGVRYRLTLRDAAGVALFSEEMNAPPFRPDPAMRAKLKRGEPYTWKVESIDAYGRVIGESIPATFRYRP